MQVIKIRHIIFITLACCTTGAYAGTTSGTMDASNMFGNATDDGPITICSDSLTYSQADHRLVYHGDVLVLQTKNADIRCTAAKAETSHETVYSFAEADKFQAYQQKQLAALKEAKAICKAQKGCRFLAGQTLSILFNADNKAIQKVILTTGKPYTAKFYSMPFAKAKNTQNAETITEETKTQAPEQNEKTKMYAEGQIMTFDMKSNQLTIEKNAYINRGGNRFNGEKVIYNTQSGLVTVPNTGTRATVTLNNTNF